MTVIFSFERSVLSLNFFLITVGKWWCISIFLETVNAGAWQFKDKIMWIQCAVGISYLIHCAVKRCESLFSSICLPYYNIQRYTSKALLVSLWIRLNDELIPWPLKKSNVYSVIWSKKKRMILWSDYHPAVVFPVQQDSLVL